MAGLLGDSFNYVDPGVGLAAGLLSGRGNLGANLAAGLLSGQQGAQANRQFSLVQQNAERANRANDLQQVGVLYKMALQRDALQQAQDEDAGKTHIPDPMLGVLQQKMAELAGLPPLSSGAQAVPMPQGQAPQAPSPFQYGSNPSLSQTPAPVGQNFKGANPNYQPLPMPTSQVGQLPTPIPNASSQPPQPSQYQPQAQNDVAAQLARYRRQGDAFAFAGLDPIAQNRYKLGIPTVSRGVSFNPSNGLPIAGFVDNVPVQFQNGQPQVIKSDIPQAIADRAGMVAGAQSAATSPFKTVNYTDASGASNPRFLPQIPGYPGAQPSGARAAYTPPPVVLTAAQRGAPFVATQAPGGPVQFQTPPNASAANDNAKADPWATMPTIPAPGGGGYTAHQSYLDNARKEATTRLGEQYQKDAETANQRIATNNQALELLDRADTGTGAALMGDIKTFLVSRVGIPESDFKNDPAATTALNKDLMNAAIAKAKANYAGAGRMTQQEVMNQIKRGAPNGDMLQGAIRFLLQSDNVAARYDIQRANDFGTAIAKNGDPLLFPQWYTTAFPLTKALDSVQLAPNTPNNGASGYGWSVKRVK